MPWSSVPIFGSYEMVDKKIWAEMQYTLNRELPSNDV